MRPSISYSELSEFANSCQHRWKLNYLEGRRSKVFSVHMDFGTAVHEAVEKHLTRKDPVDAPTAVGLFREKFTRLLSENSAGYPKPVSEKDRNGLLAAGENILQSLLATPELQGVEVIYNEFKLDEPIARSDGVEIRFKGYIDMVIKAVAKNKDVVLYVCDFKTCSWGWDRETREDRWKQYQLFLYKHFLCKRFDLDPKYVRTAFVLLKKRPQKGVHPVEFFPVSAGPVSVQRALNVLNENITEMAAREAAGGVYPKNRESCLDKYGNTCPYLHTDLCPDDA